MVTFAAHRREILSGARAMVPWLAGVAPFGLVIGVSSAHAAIPTLTGVLSGPLIYSGSAQLATIQLLSAGATPVVVIATGLVINARLVLYSAGIARHWRGTPLWWRLGAAYLLVDPSFAVGIDRYARTDDRGAGHAHYLGGAIVLWVGWLAAIVAGAMAGSALPAWLHLELVIPLYLIGEVIPSLNKPTVRRAVPAAAIVALAAFAAPMHLGVALAILAGLAAGSWIRPDRPRRTEVPA
jgi:predicted branched-subunit amino acid permease